MIALTLKDTMKQFDLPELIAIKGRLEISQEILRGVERALDNSDKTSWLDLLSRIHEFCGRIGFHHAGAKAYAIRLRLDKFPEEFTGRTLAAHFEGLDDDLEICMFQHRFIQVDQAVAEYLGSAKLFDETVLVAFPNAKDDIEDAGSCIAVDLNSSAVFHLMHVVEWGMRAFSGDLGLLSVPDGKGKKRIPIQFAQWESILSLLPEKIEAKLVAMPKGDEKQKAQEFYYSSLSEIRAFKDAWRNHIMHTRVVYTREDALSVFSHVRRFMKNLAVYGISGGLE
jgi:hypothetical protein